MEFKLPDIGEGIHEGEITKWLVKVGDTLSADQPMVEVMTDKATVEIPSPVVGVVKEIVFKEGQTVEVGKVLIRIDEAGKTTSSPPKVEAPKPAAPRTVSPITEAKPAARAEEVLDFHILATPATRKLARDLSVDLKNLKGTGLNGRLTRERQRPSRDLPILLARTSQLSHHRRPQERS